MRYFSSKHQRGFSLLEIMIVIIIIGIGASAISLAVTQDDPLEDVEKTADAFSYWFGTKLDTALLTNTEVGLYFTETAVALMSWREGDKDKGEEDIVWELKGEPVPYSEGFDDLKTEVMLDIESQQWLALDASVPDDGRPLLPHVYIFPSEEYQPSFIIHFTNRDYSDEEIKVVADRFNRLKVTREKI